MFLGHMYFYVADSLIHNRITIFTQSIGTPYLIIIHVHVLLLKFLKSEIVHSTIPTD